MNDLRGIQSYSESQQSLMNSRKRLNCEASQRESQLDRQNQQALHEFERQIQQRYRSSIANKLYTFPRFIKSFSDVISSDESSDEEEEDTQFRNYFNKIENRDEKGSRNFKKKKSIDRDIESIVKIKTTNTQNKKSGSKEMKETNITKFQVEKVKLKPKEKKKQERLKTEPESSNSFMQTIRSKAAKKN